MKMMHVAVIGLGYWGPNLVRNFSKISGVKVVYGCDLIEKNLQTIVATFPSVKPTRNYQDILRDETIDLVAIATPVSTHFKLAKEALMAGKHVLIEKPMVQTSRQAEELTTLAKKRGKLLFVEHTFVYAPAVQAMKDLIVKKELGKIFYYDSVRVNLGLLQPDINVIWDLAPHDFSILRYLFREQPISVFALGASYVQKKHIELAHVMVKYRNNITAHVHVSWLSPVKIRNISIAGSKKMIVYNDIEPSEKIRIYDKSVSASKVTPFAPAYRSGDVCIPHLAQDEALYVELQHVIDCLRHKKKPMTDGADGLFVVMLLEASDRSIRSRAEITL